MTVFGVGEVKAGSAQLKLEFGLILAITKKDVMSALTEQFWLIESIESIEGFAPNVMQVLRTYRPPQKYVCLYAKSGVVLRVAKRESWVL